MTDEHDPTPRAAERLGNHLDALIEDRRPSPQDITDETEARMARLAAELTGSTPAEPDHAFVEQLRLRLRDADEALAAVRRSAPRPLDPVPGGRMRISRRTLLHLGLGSAAGLAAGALGVSWLRSPDSGLRPGDTDRGVSPPGEWVEVASLDQLPAGEAVRFSTAEFEGYVVNDGGEIRALSAVCTHLACTLEFRRERQDLRCPCHGASFDLSGSLANGADRWQEGAYGDDVRPYPIDLPPLARPQVRVEEGRVLVWIARA